MLTALAPIPECLRGLTWLTISELAMVARVPEVMLDSVLTPLRKNHKTLQMLRIAKAKEQPNGKQAQSELAHLYRPFNDFTVRAQHSTGTNTFTRSTSNGFSSEAHEV